LAKGNPNSDATNFNNSEYAGAGTFDRKLKLRGKCII
jgi:hypothetical protein